MNVNEIEKLPSEFDFVSRINMSGIVYHARETKIGYIISWEASDWNGKKYSLSDSCDKIEFWKKLKVDDYVPVGVKENLPKKPESYIPEPKLEPLEEGANYNSDYKEFMDTVFLAEKGDRYDCYRKEYNDAMKKFLDSYNPELQKSKRK